MKTPLISIIVPVYNCEKYLPQCIESILHQTYTNLQIILIDDGSADSSGKICDNYAVKDVRIEVIHQPNMGVSAARNAGLKVMRGEYVGFVDSDDYLEPDMYTYLHQLLTKYQVPIAICNFYNLFAEKQTKSIPLKSVTTIWNGPEILSHCFKQMFSWNKLFASSLFASIQYNPSCGYGEDIYVCAQLFEKAGSAVYGPQAKYYYRKYGNTATTSLKWDPKYLGYFSEIEPVIQYAQKYKLATVVSSFKSARINLAITFLRRCIHTQPFDKKSAFLLQQYIRQHLLFYLFKVRGKITKKVFAVCVSISLSSTYWFYLIIKKRIK